MNRIIPIAAAAAGLALAIAIFMLGRAGEGPASPVSPTSSGPGRDSAAARPAPAAPDSTAAPPPAARTPEAAPRSSAPSRPSPEAAPELGTLYIDADVPSAQVFIDRRFIGTTPVTAENLTPGAHQLNVSAPGFDSVRETIDVEPGPRELTIRLREVRLDAAVPVVHRHRFGSCTGQLIATLEGLRYETANMEDAFTSTLADLSVFEVNYQERNLRIGLRGREYNFTDPEGNADRLFVFHRDVERVRRQLAKGGEP